MRRRLDRVDRERQPRDESPTRERGATSEERRGDATAIGRTRARRRQDATERKSLPFAHSGHNSAGKTDRADAEGLPHPALRTDPRPWGAWRPCARRAAGDGVLELRDVNATKADIYAKGAVWGQLDYGKLKVTDFDPDDNITAQVSGAESKRTTREPGVTIYTRQEHPLPLHGQRLHQVQHHRLGHRRHGGRLRPRAARSATRSGYDDGDYALDNGKWQPVPLTSTARSCSAPSRPSAP